MARKYNKKFPQKKATISSKKIKKRDGNWYIVYEIPLEISEEDLEYSLSLIGGLHLGYYKDWYEKGGLMRNKHGRLTGRRDKYLERNKLIYQLYKNAVSNRVIKCMIPEIINGELRKQKYLKKRKTLSDIRIRHIVCKFKKS